MALPLDAEKAIVVQSVAHFGYYEYHPADEMQRFDSCRQHPERRPGHDESPAGLGLECELDEEWIRSHGLETLGKQTGDTGLNQRMGELSPSGIGPAFRDTAAQVLEFGFQHICIATGAKWRSDGRGRFRFDPIDACPHERVVAPGLIAQAVFSGHRFARERGANDIEVDRDRVVIQGGL